MGVVMAERRGGDDRREASWMDGFARTAITFFLGFLVQAVWYNLAVRDDIRDLKKDMSEVRCTVAVFTHAPQLPPNCVPGR